jgi:hypothetical protein
VDLSVLGQNVDVRMGCKHKDARIGHGHDNTIGSTARLLKAVMSQTWVVLM